jgi:putative acetyltransferase
MGLQIRNETPADAAIISALTTEAFLTAAHSAGTEAAIVDGLRQAGALRLSLVAEDETGLIGHVAASDVAIDGRTGWIGIGPISVRPSRQNQGIGSALMGAVLDRLRAEGAKGVVLVGEPAYYRRFGFASQAGLGVKGIPADYVLAIAFTDEAPAGTITFHEAFGLT